MVLKIFRAIWFVSMLAAVAMLMYVYASLPEKVTVQDSASGRIEAHREFFFYVLMGVILIVNALVYATTRLFEKEEGFRAWFHGLIVTINIFLIVAMSFVNVYNSLERFDYKSIGFLIYGSVALVLIWALAWPVYRVFNKNQTKHLVS